MFTSSQRLSASSSIQSTDSPVVSASKSDNKYVVVYFSRNFNLHYATSISTEAAANERQGISDDW